jgi:hypothetical protein
LLQAFTGCRVNNAYWLLIMLELVFDQADKDRLRAAGDPLPGPGPFTLYRGVAGRGSKRRVRGMSWTGSIERARWFATRWRERFGNPGVYQAIVFEADVLAYVNHRQEDEYIVRLPQTCRPRCVERLQICPENDMGGAKKAK